MVRVRVRVTCALETRIVAPSNVSVPLWPRYVLLPSCANAADDARRRRITASTLAADESLAAAALRLRATVYS